MQKENSYSLDTFSSAVELARIGRYEEAEQLLSSLIQDEVLRPFVLDMQAKIYAQKQHYPDAKKCWLEASRLVPENQQYQKAAELANAKERQPLPYFPRYSFLGGIVVILVGLFFYWIRDAYHTIELGQQSILSQSRENTAEWNRKYEDLVTTLGERIELVVKSQKELEDSVSSVKNQLGKSERHGEVTTQAIQNITPLLNFSQEQVLDCFGEMTTISK
jgi:tetratricopeptide (TPR) repeat protein